jgi:hypothetical protein
VAEPGLFVRLQAKSYSATFSDCVGFWSMRQTLHPGRVLHDHTALARFGADLYAVPIAALWVPGPPLVWQANAPSKKYFRQPEATSGEMGLVSAVRAARAPGRPA